MHLQSETLTPTSIKLTITAEPSDLSTTKQHVLKDLASQVKVQGFRAGKAPAKLVEKHVEPSVLQTQFLDHAVNDLYVAAVRQQAMRPVAQPEIAVTKFVPFTTLEFTAQVDIVGDIKLADYKKIKLDPKPVEVTAADVNKVLEGLRERSGDKQPVDRAAKLGDEVTIDFFGTDAKTNEPISGADGKDHPLVLGSKTFIPGFEEELVGLKPGGKKEFELTFPADYGVKLLQSRKVKFAVTATKVSEVAKPKLDDSFAANVGPFKKLTELKADIKKQLIAERQREAQSNYDTELLETIAAKSTLDLPPALIDEEINRIEEEEKRNIVYRGQTWQEHLKEEGLSADQHRDKQRPAAERNLRAGLVLGEIAHAEGITVTPEELEIRLMLLKNQYPEDAAMQTELENPDNRRDVRNRLMTEKTLEKLRSYATTEK